MVKSKFIETEVGTIPSCWSTIRLIEIAENKKELFDDGDWVESEHITNQGIRLIQTGNIGLGKFLEKGIKKYISSKSFETLRCKELQIGDLLICRLAEPAGRSCIFEGTEDEKVITSVDVTIFRPNYTRYDRKYLNQYFTTNFWLSAVSENSGGTTHKRISRGTLGKLYVPLPPLPEQTAIATALSDMDALIAQTEKLIEKKKAIKQGVMQELLRPKEGWVTKKLGEVANCFAGGTPSTFNREFWGGKIPWLPSGRVKNNIIKPIENEITITDLGLNSSAAKMIKPNSILMAITGATCGNIGLLTFGAAANQSVVAIEKNDEFDSVLIYYILLTMRDDILRLQTGSAQGGVNLKSVKSLEVIIPEKIEEQNEISQILLDFDKEMETYNQKLIKLKLQKQGMMRALLTGKIRLI